MAKILVVEDDHSVASSIEEFLKAEQHTIDVVHNGMEALERLDVFHYDVMVLDWHLPGMNGIDVCKNTRATGSSLLDENIELARFSNLLFNYTGRKDYQLMAKQAMRYLSTPSVARIRRILVAGILIADRQISTAPFHITVVGGKKDAQAKALYLTALKSPSVYRRIEWYDRAEGNLANMDVEYPELPKAAAFSCGNGTCSTPAYDAAALSLLVEKRARM